MLVDYIQLIIPNLYQQVINGVNLGWVEVDGQRLPFDLDFLLGGPAADRAGAHHDGGVQGHRAGVV